MHKFFLSATLLISSLAMAEDSWQISFAGGFATLAADNMVLYVTEYEHDKAIQTNDDDWKSWTAQVGIGYVIPLFNNTQWFTTIEPQINGYFLQGNINGYVDRFYQYDIDCEDVDFQMDLISRRVMFDLALNVATWKNLSVYGIAGIGAAWNTISYHHDADEFYLPVYIKGHTQTDFAYEFGGGLSYALLENLSLTAEYLYTGFSDLSLDDSSGVESDDFSLNSQAVLFGFNFGF